MKRFLPFLFLIEVIFFTSCLHAKINVRRSAKVRVANGARLDIENQVEDFKGTLVRESGGEITGGDIVFNDGVYDDGGTVLELTGKINVGTSKKIKLDGNKKFKGKRGEVLQAIYISNHNNLLEGFIEISNDVFVQDLNSGFTCALTGRVPRNIDLNGGSVFLKEDLHFVDDMFFLGNGIIQLNSRKLSLGSTVLTCDSPLYFDRARDIELNANFHLAETWTFSGVSIFNGNGMVLYLDDGGNLVVEQGSSLLLRNITVRNVSGNNIRCLDSAATLSFQDVTLIQDGNFGFTTGSIDVLGELELVGSSTFAYQSAQTSTVWAHGKLIIDQGMTFSFDPIWNSNYSMTCDAEEMIIDPWEQARGFLVFEDETSVLKLKNSTLHVTSTNMKLKKGTLLVSGNSYIMSVTTGEFCLEEGLIIGDNSSDDDMVCKFKDSSTLEILGGTFSYKNIDSSSWSMLSNYSIFSIASGVSLRLHQTLDVGSGVVNLQDESILARADGKELLGSVHIGGVVTNEVCYN